MCIEIDSMSLFDFVEWLGSCSKKVLFFVFSLVNSAFRHNLYTFHVLWCILLALYIYLCTLGLSKNKKKVAK